jgi:5-methylcytosine-specific restriction endonuclease McrA
MGGMLRTHYELLEVAPDADAAVIKGAYLKLSRTLHPDMPHGSTALFGMVTEAYEVLNDPQRRASYDLSLTTGTRPPPPPPRPAPTAPSPAPPSAPSPPPSAPPRTPDSSPRSGPAGTPATRELRRTSAARKTVPLLILDQLVQRLPRWVKTRRGFVCLGLATLVAGQGGDPGTVVANFLMALVVIAGLLWLVAKNWESRTWPGTAPFARVRRYSAQSHQFRADVNGRLFQDRGGFLFERRYFFTATGLPPVRLSAEFVSDVQKRAATSPAKVVTEGARTWWQFENGFWWENVGYQAADVMALLKDRERRHRRELDRAHMLLRAEASPRNPRGPISREMQRAVFERDGGACVACGGTFSIQYDHIIPVAMGGATTIENLQVLCSYCNQAKGASI